MSEYKNQSNLSSRKLDISEEDLNRAEQKLVKCKTIVYTKFVFWQVLFSKFTLYWDTDILTAQVDTLRRITINPNFWNKLNFPQSLFLLLHEIAHAAFGHLWRGEAFVTTTKARIYIDPKTNRVCPENTPGAIQASLDVLYLYKLACDYVINQILVDCMNNMGNPALKDPMKRNKDGRLMGLLDEKYRGMTTEQVVMELIKEVKESQRQIKMGDSIEGDGGGDSNEGQPKSGKGKGQSKSKKSKPGDGESEDSQSQSGSSSGEGKGKNGDGPDPDKKYQQIKVDTKGQEEFDEHVMSDEKNPKPGEPSKSHDDLDWESLLRVARQQAQQRNRGDMPGSLEALLEEILEPKVSWQEELRAVLATSVATVKLGRSEFSWSRVNGRYLHQNWYLPAMVDAAISIGTLTDTSGSMMEAFTQVAAELEAIQEESQARMLLVFGDTDVQTTREIRIGEKIEFDGLFRGCGGTVLTPLFEYICNPDKIPFPLDIKIVLTDGYIEQIDDKYNTGGEYVWVIFDNADFNPPFGEAIHVNID